MGSDLSLKERVQPLQLLNGFVLWVYQVFLQTNSCCCTYAFRVSWHFHWVNMVLMHIITYIVRVSFVLLNILTKGSRLVFQVVLAKSFVYQAFVFDETWLMDDLQYFLHEHFKNNFFSRKITIYVHVFYTEIMKGKVNLLSFFSQVK